MRLPNADQAQVERAKAAGYLLAAEHPRGWGKATAFLRFGFSPERWEEFAEAARIHAASYEVTGVREFQNALHYAVEGVLVSPDGRNPYVRTVWAIDEESGAPRLVTAYLRRRRRDAQRT